jgi:hypothetical protein
MSKIQHTSKVSESSSDMSLIARIKAFFGKGRQAQETDPSAIETDEGNVAGSWKKQIGAIMPQRKTKAIAPVKHGGDGEANQTPSNLG